MTTTESEPVQVTIARNGPYIVTGPITMTDHDDTTVAVPQDRPVALCRCGQSANKPFCDGTHASTDFDGSISPSDGTPS